MYFVLLVSLALSTPVYAETGLKDEVVYEQLGTDTERAKRIKKYVQKAESLDKKIKLVDEKIIKIIDSINLLKIEIEGLDKKEVKSRNLLKEKLGTFNETAVTIARLERMPIEAMAAASSLRAAHNRKGIIEGGRRSLSSSISKNRADIYELQDIRIKRQEKVSKIESLRSNRLDQKERLEKLFAKQVKLLAIDDESKAKMLKNAHKMKEQKTLNNLLKDYKNTEAYLPKSRTSLKLYPVKGKVVRGYNQKNNIGVRAHGITIETTSSEPVVAVKNGRVIYSDSFREYGYIVILEHADGSNSLYSGMGSSVKKVGDFIYAGNKIGLMPTKEKPKFYLEIRKGGKTLNPSKYLAKG